MEVERICEDHRARRAELVSDPAALGAAIGRLGELGVAAARVAAGNAGLQADLAFEVAEVGKAGVVQAHNLGGQGGLPTAGEFVDRLPASAFAVGGRVSLAKLGCALATLMYDGAPCRVLLGCLDAEPVVRQSAARAAASAAAAGAAAAAASAAFAGGATEGGALRTAEFAAANAASAAYARVPIIRDAFATKRVAEVNDSMVVAEARNAVRNSELFIHVAKVLDGADGKPRMTRVVTCDDGRSRQVLDMVSTLFDPWSYSQTVENLFYFSFLVKEKLAGVFLDPAGGIPLITLVRNDDEDAPPPAPAPAAAAAAATPAGRGRPAAAPVAPALRIVARQFVVQLDMQSWKALCTSRGITEPLMPHRKSRDSTAPPGYAFFVDDAPRAGTKRKADPATAAASAAKRPHA